MLSKKLVRLSARNRNLQLSAKPTTVVIPAGTIIYQQFSNQQLCTQKSMVVSIVPEPPEDTSRDPYG